MLEEKAAPNDIKNLTTWSETFVSKLASLWFKNGNILHYFVHYIYSGSFICLAELQRECKPQETAVLKQRKIRQILLTACKIHTPDRHTCITNIHFMCSPIHQTCTHAYCIQAQVHTNISWIHDVLIHQTWPNILKTSTLTPTFLTHVLVLNGNKKCHSTDLVFVLEISVGAIFRYNLSYYTFEQNWKADQFYVSMKYSLIYSHPQK